MKFEFSLAVKAAPMVDCHISLDCSTDELALLINDPAYQELGRVLATKLQQSDRQAPTNQRRGNRHDHGANQPNDRFDCLRRVMEADRKCQANHNKAVDAALKSLQDQFSRALDHIIRN